MLVAYTAKKLAYKPKHECPVIHIYPNGCIYLYRSLLNKLEVNPEKDRILFSLDAMSGEWFISKSIDGLPIHFTSKKTRNQSYYLASSSLRDKIIKTASTLFYRIDSNDCFYMKCASDPKLFNNHSDQQFYNIQIIK